MTTPTAPAPPPVPPESAPAPRRRLRSRGGVIGAIGLALVIVGVVAAALIIPGVPGGRPAAVSGVGLLGEQGDLWPLRGPGGRGHNPADSKGGVGTALGNDALLAGTVVAADNGTLVIAVDGGPQRTLRADDRTRVRGSGAAALSSLKPGERVVVRVSGSGDAATALSVMSPQARVTGTVTAITGDIATVMGIDGRPATVNIAKLTQKPVVGDIVIVTGLVTDGSTISADRIRVLPKAS